MANRKPATKPQQELPPWPADNVERRALSALTPYASNPRLHSPQQVGQIAASILEYVEQERAEKVAEHA